MKIHAGCGQRIWDGWCNVDIAVHPKAPRPPEILADVRSIPLLDDCADELVAVHLFEHFYLWETEDLLTEWGRLLKPGGKLILELPDIVKAAKNLLAGTTDQQSMWAIYGDPQTRNLFMGHHWGWTLKTIKPVLERHGFGDVVETPPQFHRAGQAHRDFRVEAVLKEHDNGR